MTERTYRNPGYWTFDRHARAYYFFPADRAAPPYRTQQRVTAVLDIALDGTLAGIELVGDNLPDPPPNRSYSEVITTGAKALRSDGETVNKISD